MLYIGTLQKQMTKVQMGITVRMKQLLIVQRLMAQMKKKMKKMKKMKKNQQQQKKLLKENGIVVQFPPIFICIVF